MKKSSINELLSLIEKREQDAEGKKQKTDAEPKAEKAADPAAERIGRALLDKFADSGIPEDRLADAIIAAWEKTPATRSEEPEGEGHDETADELMPELKAGGKPFPGAARTPMPIKSGASANAPIDYEGLTDKQFRQLKKQLQRAASEGKRVKL